MDVEVGVDTQDQKTISKEKEDENVIALNESIADIQRK
jgi:hypothetical protein